MGVEVHEKYDDVALTHDIAIVRLQIEKAGTLITGGLVLDKHYVEPACLPKANCHLEEFTLKADGDFPLDPTDMYGKYKRKTNPETENGKPWYKHESKPNAIWWPGVKDGWYIGDE